MVRWPFYYNTEGRSLPNEAGMLREHGMSGNCVAATTRPPQQDGCIGEAGRPSSDTSFKNTYQVLYIRMHAYECVYIYM